jgi:DNA-binding transcriptional LysR family regulator
MVTIKQIEAFYWVAKLGTLNKAAERLHITQSAATKRLQEVEAVSAVPLFEIGGRKNLVTQKGSELVSECEKLFSLLDELDMLRSSDRQPARILHIGLTELTALTWFPSFVRRMRAIYPAITIQPEIDLSSPLRLKVEAGRLDFAILPDPPPVDGLARMALGPVAFGWFAAAGTFESQSVHSLRDLAAFPVIEQSANSIITELCTQLWENAGVQPERIYGGNNVNALAGLISAGVGISCLPIVLFEQEVQRGELQLVATQPAAPSVTYYCCFFKQPHSGICYAIADIAKNCYSLSQMGPHLRSPADPQGD